jgi:hypothetical protein
VTRGERVQDDSRPAINFGEEASMSSVEHEAGPEFPYRVEEVFKAVVVGVDNLPGMRVERQDPASGQILIETGLTPRGGRKYPVTVVRVGPDRTRLDFAALTGEGSRDRGDPDPEKNRATIGKIVDATSEVLQAFAARDIARDR